MIPPRTPTRTVRPASVDLPLFGPSGGWSSPFGERVASSVIVRFLSTRVYPGSARRLRRFRFRFVFAHGANSAPILLGDLFDRQFRGGDDGPGVLAAAGVFRPVHGEVAALAATGDLDMGDVAQAHPSGLEQR